MSVDYFDFDFEFRFRPISSRRIISCFVWCCLRLTQAATRQNSTDEDVRVERGTLCCLEKVTCFFGVFGVLFPSGSQIK